MKPIWLHYKPLTGILDQLSDPDAIPQGALRQRLNFYAPQKNKLGRAPGWKKLFYEDTFAAITNSNVNIAAAPAAIDGVTMQSGGRVYLSGQTVTAQNGDYIWVGAGQAMVPGYNNADLHDQLLPLLNYFASQDPVSGTDDTVSEAADYPDACLGSMLTRTDQTREPVTFLREFVTTGGIRKLVAGTHSRLYCFNPSTSNWQVLADGWGGTFTLDCRMRRWRAAQIGDVAIFTNNFDPPLYWLIGSGPSGCAMQAVRTVPQLADLRITSAAVVIAWKGLMFLMDVTMDGQRWANRLVWSDYEDAMAYDPGVTGTQSGDQVLDQGETILNALDLGDYLLIYTDKSIWQVSAVGGDEILNFRRVYSETKTGEACLVYSNTLVSLGDAHVFMGADGIYLFNLSMPKPDRIEWLHAAAGPLFNDINAECCYSHVAEFNPQTKEVYFSWVRNGQVLPDQTLVANMRYLVANFLDHGFTVFCNHAKDYRMTLRDFLLAYCICDIDDVAGMPYIKEGLPRIASQAGACTKPTSLYTSSTLHLAINDEDIEIEDWTAKSPSANSLCSRLSGLRLADLCQQCKKVSVFIAASSVDLCLKEMGGVYYRHRCLNPTTVNPVITTGSWPTHQATVGQYAVDGYQSIMIGGPIDLSQPSTPKSMRALEVEFHSEPTTDPPELVLEVGQAAQAIDPLSEAGRCTILWQRQVINRFFLECQSYATAEEHVVAGTRPDATAFWPLFVRNKYCYWRLIIDKAANDPPGTLPINGAVTFSRASLKFQA